MDKTILTLAVDSSQVGTAAAALERMTGAGNAAATAGAKVATSASAQGKALSQTAEAAKKGKVLFTDLASAAEKLSPRAMAQIAAALADTAAEAGKASTAVLSLNRAAAATPQISTQTVPTITAAAPSARTPLAAPAPTSVTTGVTVPTAILAADATRAQTAVDRLTAAATAQRSALAQLAPVTEATAAAYRQIAAAPVRIAAPEGLSPANAALRTAASFRQPVAIQPGAQESSGSGTTQAVAPNPASTNAFTAAAARGTTAVNALAAAEGRAAEAARSLAEANARNEAAQASLNAALVRAASAQTAYDNATRASGNNTAAIATAQARLQTAQAGVSVASVNAARAQREAATAADRHREALSATGRQSQLSTAQIQGLTHSVHSFVDMIVAGQNPLKAFGLEAARLTGTFGTVGGTFRAVTGLLTPTVLGFGAAAVAVGGFALALAQAESAARDLNTLQVQLAGTGRKDLFSDKGLRDFIAQLSDLPGVSREGATAIVSEFSKVHEIGGAMFKDLATATVNYAKATGKELPDAAKELARAFAEPQKGAIQLEAALGGLSSSTILAAEDLSRKGDFLGAQRTLYEGLQVALKDVTDKGMTPLQSSVDKLGNAWDHAMRSLSQSDGLRNINALLAKTVDAVSYLVEHADKIGGIGNVGLGMIPGNQASALANAITSQFSSKDGDGKREGSGKIKPPQSATASAGAAVGTTEIDAEIKRSLEAAKSYQGQAAKIEDLTDKRARFNKALAESISLYGKNSEQAKTFRGAIAGVNEQIATARKKGAGGNEAQQVLDAQLDQKVKSARDILAAEREQMAFSQRYLQGVYQAGETSLRDFYEAKRKAIADGVQSELSELEKERAAVTDHLEATRKASPKDKSALVKDQTRLQEIDTEEQKLRTGASHETVLTNQEQEASFKALAEQVTSYRANLLQMQGDEAGAAVLRAQTTIANAKLLKTQAKDLSGAASVDVAGLARAIAITDQFNEVQRQAGLLSANGSRAEEAYSLAAEQSGKSLMETEHGLYEVRATELAQLGDLAAKAKELADASTDPRIKAFAADMALQYAKAADAIDPALNRLRDANKELAAGLAQSLGNAPNAFADAYNKRRSSNSGESRGKTALVALNEAVVQPMAKQVFDTVNKLLITDPLQKYLEGQLKGLTEGDGPLAGFFKDVLGIKADPKQQALLQQTAAINASSSALDNLKAAAENAANALNKPLSSAQSGDGKAALPANVTQVGGASTKLPAVDSELASVGDDAAQSLTAFSKEATSTASDVAKLANAAGVGGDAMGRLPGIIGLFQSAVAAMSTGGGASGGGGIFSGLASLFGGSSASAGMGYEDAVSLTGVFHEGGIVGSPPARRTVSQSTFAGAMRYHTGGIVGKAADKAVDQLKHNEVPAILMGGPKGKREEVLRADDPRHRDNLGMSVVARILNESKSSAHTSSLEAKTSESRSTVSTLLQTIAGSQGKGESSANVLAGLLGRLGVRDDSVPGAQNAIGVRGARELGGPVSAGSMYRVNEKGPELLQVAGKQYLMMGSQGGKVEPSGANQGQGKSLTLNVQVTAQPGMSRATAQQQGAQVGRGIQRSLERNG